MAWQFEDQERRNIHRCYPVLGTHVRYPLIDNAYRQGYMANNNAMMRDIQAYMRATSATVTDVHNVRDLAGFLAWLATR